jgi:hypothetical protein
MKRNRLAMYWFDYLIGMLFDLYYHLNVFRNTPLKNLRLIF